jgi:hypothetical protein
VQHRLRGLLGAMARHRDKARGQAAAVSRSYWPRLFHCYEIADLSQINNVLEHWFGMAHY